MKYLAITPKTWKNVRTHGRCPQSFFRNVKYWIVEKYFRRNVEHLKTLLILNIVKIIAYKWYCSTIICGNLKLDKIGPQKDANFPGLIFSLVWKKNQDHPPLKNFTKPIRQQVEFVRLTSWIKLNQVSKKKITQPPTWPIYL